MTIEGAVDTRVVRFTMSLSVGVQSVRLVGTVASLTTDSMYRGRPEERSHISELNTVYNPNLPVS